MYHCSQLSSVSHITQRLVFFSFYFADSHHSKTRLREFERVVCFGDTVQVSTLHFYSVTEYSMWYVIGGCGVCSIHGLLGLVDIGSCLLWFGDCMHESKTRVSINTSKLECL